MTSQQAPGPPVGNKRWWIVVPLCTILAMVVFEQGLGMQEQIIQLVCAEEQQIRNVTCDDKSISSAASNWIRWSQVAMGCGSIAMVGVAGSLSDRFGRRPVLLAAIVGYLFITVPNLLVEVSDSLRSVWRPLYVAGFAICGVSGGMSMVLLSIFAYVADSVPPDTRSMAFTIVEASIGLGGLIGDVAGGYCMDFLGPRAVFGALVASVVFLIFYCIILLPESLPLHRRSSKVNWRMLNCFYSLSCFVDPSLLRPRREVLWLAGAFMCAYFTVQGTDGISTTYLSSSPFSWSDSRIGIYNSVGLSGRLMAGMLFAPWFERYMHGEGPEVWLVRVCLLIYGGSTAMLGLGQGFADLVTYNVVAGMSGALAFGYMRGLLSKSAGANSQGKMLGGITFIVAAAQSLSPLLFNSIYSNSPHSLPGLAFYLLGGFSLLASLISLKMRPMDDHTLPSSSSASLLRNDGDAPVYGSINSPDVDSSLATKK